MNQLRTARFQTFATLRKPAPQTQRGHASVLEALLVASDRAHRTVEGPSHIVLIGPPLLDQAHQGVGFGHGVANRVMHQNQAAHHHHAISALRADETTLVDDDGAIGMACIGKEIIRGVGRHGGRRYCLRSKKRTVLGPHPANSRNREIPAKPGTVYASMSGVLDSGRVRQLAEIRSKAAQPLNAGHKHGAMRMRSNGGGGEIQFYNVFGAVALGGIGSLPGTLADRSIVIHLLRAQPGEIKQPFDLRHAEKELALQQKLARWTNDVHEQIRCCRPIMPDRASNRCADNWRPLVTMAEVAGGDWRRRATDAFNALNGSSVGCHRSPASELL